MEFRILGPLEVVGASGWDESKKRACLEGEFGGCVDDSADCPEQHRDVGERDVAPEPREPDPEADVGSHLFSYALLPHAGGWPADEVVAEAATFNAPILWLPAGAEPRSFARVKGGLVLDTIKRAEDGDGLVVRLYEPCGARGTARLDLGLPVERATRCNLLEDRVGAPEPLRDGVLEIAYRPFEIITLRAE